MRASEIQTGMIIDLAGIKVPYPPTRVRKTGSLGEIKNVRRGWKWTYLTMGNYSVVKIANDTEVTVVETLLRFETIFTKDGTDGLGRNRDVVHVHARSRDAALKRASQMNVKPGSMWKGWSFDLALTPTEYVKH